MFSCSPLKRACKPLLQLNRFGVSPRRSYSMLNYISKEKVNYKKVSLGLVGMAMLYYLYPKSPYPHSVNKPLRSGLFKELKYSDYETSLRFYIDALNECDKLYMNKCHMDYTGIELKIAEMYERLNRYKDAESVYLNILKRLSNELRKNRSSNSMVNGEMIKRDLSVLSKILDNRLKFEHDTNNIQEELSLIESHLKLATNEIFRREPSLFNLIMQNSSDKKVVEYNSVNHDLSVSQYSHCFEPFQEEFIKVRDQYTERCLEYNDIREALDSNMVTVGWMILMKRPQRQILLSQSNTGSLLYLKVEQLDLQIDQLLKQNLVEEAKPLISTRDYLLDMSTKFFENVIANSGKTQTRNHFDEPMDQTTLQAISLSLYGLGVTNMHRGKYGKAQLFLRDSLAIARDHGFTDIQEEAQNEIEKCSTSLKKSNRTSV